MLRHCLFTLAFLAAGSAAYGQRSSRRADQPPPQRYEHRSHHRDQDHDDDRNTRRRSDCDEEAGGRERRRVSVVALGRSGRLEVNSGGRERGRFSVLVLGRSGRLEVSSDGRSGREERNWNRRRPSVPVFTFGPKVGVNYATLLENPVPLQTGYRLGYHIGGFMRFNLRRAYIQPEVLYSTKGGTLDLTQNAGALYQPGKYEAEVNTVDVPVLLGARLLTTRSFNLRAFAGPMASFMVGGQGLENFLNENETTRTYLPDVMLAYQAGVGLDLGPITLDLRYEWTISEIADLRPADLGSPRSSLFQASVGIKMF